MIFKNHAPFTASITLINNTQIDGIKDIHGVVPMLKLCLHAEEGDNYVKISGSYDNIT